MLIAGVCAVEEVKDSDRRPLRIGQDVPAIARDLRDDAGDIGDTDVLGGSPPPILGTYRRRAELAASLQSDVISSRACCNIAG